LRGSNKKSLLLIIVWFIFEVAYGGVQWVVEKLEVIVQLVLWKERMGFRQERFETIMEEILALINKL